VYENGKPASPQKLSDCLSVAFRGCNRKNQRNVLFASGLHMSIMVRMRLALVLRFSVVLAWTAIIGLTFAAAGTNSINWRTRQNRVDARIESMDLQTLLAKVAAATGWKVYVEPDTTRQVSAKFKNTPSGEALKLLLGDLNFALVPQTDAPSKLYVFRTVLQRATQFVAAAEDIDDRSQKAIPNERIVTLKPGSKESIDDLAKRLGAKVVGKIDGANSYRLQFADEAAARAAEQAIATGKEAESDYNFEVDRPTRAEPLADNAPVPFSLKLKVSTDSSQVIVGLIDTTVQPLPADMSGFVLPGLQVAGDAGNGAPNDLTHGTSMAETILHGLNLAPKETGGSSVRILPVDIYGGNEDTTTFDVANGIYTAINSGATIINLSLAGDGDSRFLANMIADARKQGVLFFGAAGNEPTTAPTYPAAYSGVVAVTASDRRGNIAPYANRGSFVDVAAPGNSLVQFGGESFIVSGTSASTAYVSGTAAGYRASGQTADQVEATIREALAVKTSTRPPPINKR
jgi:thermitase